MVNFILKRIKNKKIKIGIVGAGYVGLPLAKLISKKFNVTLYDNKNKIKSLIKQAQKNQFLPHD